MDYTTEGKHCFKDTHYYHSNVTIKNGGWGGGGGGGDVESHFPKAPRLIKIGLTNWKVQKFGLVFDQGKRRLLVQELISSS